MAEARLSQARLAPDDDLPLLDRVLEGDTRAFDQLVERHESRVYRVAMAITGNHQDAEEAMQDAFLKAHRHLREFQRASKFSTWLTRIAVNEALQICRRRRTTESLDDPTWTDEGTMPKQVRDWHDDPEKIYSKQQIQDIVARAIQSLPPLFRKALVLRDIESLSAEEAADALGIGVPALKSRLLRARLMMREALAVHFQRPPTLKSRVFEARWKIQAALGAHVGQVSGKKGDMVAKLNCREVLAELSDYLDGEVAPEVKQTLEEHLAKCNQCSLVYNTTRKMLKIVTEAGTFAVPLELSTRLRLRLRELLAKAHGR